MTFVDTGGIAANAKEVPCRYYLYKIYKNKFKGVKTASFTVEASYSEFPFSFEESQGLYQSLADELNRKPLPKPKIVIDFIEKYFSDWYFYYAIYLNKIQN